MFACLNELLPTESTYPSVSCNTKKKIIGSVWPNVSVDWIYLIIIHAEDYK